MNQSANQGRSSATGGTASPENGPVVIVGAGQAGLQVALSLRSEGYSGKITLVGDEPGLPYGRPPLSKAYLLGKVDEAGLHLRPADVLIRQGIVIAAPERVVAIDRSDKSITLASGRSIPYAHLVLATGTRNRLPPLPGIERAGVLSLRSLNDASILKSRLSSARSVVIIGAGFIGLEFAAVASASGLIVDVVEAAPRVLARAVSIPISNYLAQRHSERGVRFTLGANVTAIEGGDDGATGVRLGTGSSIKADLVLVATGVLPNSELAAEAGLRVDDGIVVDDHLTTPDPAISAIGDCATHPNVHAGGMRRLESVQNAVDQAKVVAARLCGKRAPYHSVPWFWSDQASDKLQIAGLSAMSDTMIITGDQAEGRFAVLSFRRDRLASVETINWPGEHIAARRALALPEPPTRDVLEASSLSLKAWLSTGAPSKIPYS